MYGLFSAEGDKVVRELLTSNLPVNKVYAVSDWISVYGHLVSPDQLEEVSAKELERITEHRTPNGVLAVAPLPRSQEQLPDTGWILALDRIRDPGNLGTLLRTADWFGLSAVVLSPECVDPWNSKVIQSAMGSLFRLPIIHKALDALITESGLQAFGADAGGKDYRQVQLPSAGILVIGNEARGLDPAVAPSLDQILQIPGQGEAESLNAAVAGGILMAALPA